MAGNKLGETSAYYASDGTSFHRAACAGTAKIILSFTEPLEAKNAFSLTQETQWRFGSSSSVMKQATIIPLVQLGSESLTRNPEGSRINCENPLDRAALIVNFHWF